MRREEEGERKKERKDERESEKGSLLSQQYVLHQNQLYRTSEQASFNY